MRVEIEHLTVMTGRLTPAKQRLRLDWAAVHKEELVRNWILARQGQPHEPIDPTVSKEED